MSIALPCSSKPCLLARADDVIGISGGEPTLYKAELLGMIERVLTARPAGTHITMAASIFEGEDIARLRAPLFRRILWRHPAHAHDAALRDIVRLKGAFTGGEPCAPVADGARVELRTDALVRDNFEVLPELARYLAPRLRLRSTPGRSCLRACPSPTARELYVRLYAGFQTHRRGLDHAKLYGVPAHLFNFPRCTVSAPIAICWQPRSPTGSAVCRGPCDGLPLLNMRPPAGFFRMARCRD